MNYRIQSASVHLSRAVYALNWFDIAPGLKYIAGDLDLRIIQLGIITTAFYVGLASFQLVGGLIASRIGNRKTSFLGLIILGSSVILSSMSGNLAEMFVTRLSAGMGSALFFSPALAMLSSIVPESKYSLHVGIYNGAFNIGAGVGIFGWGFLDQVIGWRAGLAISGAIMLAVAVENFLILDNVAESRVFGRQVFRKAGTVLSSLAIWILPVAAAGGILTETLMGQLFVYYAEFHLSMSESLASTIGAFAMIFGAVGGVIGGFHFGKTTKKMATFAGTLLVVSLLVMSIPVFTNPVILSFVVSIIGVFTVDSLSILYTLTAQTTSDRSMVSFALAFINFVQMSIGAVAPVLFTTLVFYSGYEVSWIVIGVISLACISLLSLIYRPGRNRNRSISGIGSETTR